MKLREGENSSYIDEFSKLMDGRVPRGTGAEEIGVDDGRVWGELANGGWLDLGAPEEAEGGGLTMKQLSLFSMVWGRHVPAHPFSETVLARRWGDTGSVGTDVRRTFSVPTVDGVAARFAAQADTTCLAALPTTDGATVELSGSVDGFAPSLEVLRAADGTDIGAAQLHEYRCLLAAESIGAAEEAFDRAVLYSQEREAYGRPISAFQSLRHWIADLHRDLELSKASLFTALDTDDPERGWRALCSSARLSRRVASGTIQVFGGVGFTWELGIHFYVRHTMACEELIGGRDGAGDLGSEASGALTGAGAST